MNTPITHHPAMPDERAIENLMVEYAYRNDDFDIQGLGELFADAAFTLDGLTVQNRSEVEGLAAQIIKARDDGRSATTHEITNVMIQVDPTAATAVGRAYWTLYLTITGQPRQALQSGRYDDSFRKSGDRWSYIERRATTLWRLEP